VRLGGRKTRGRVGALSERDLGRDLEGDLARGFRRPRRGSHGCAARDTEEGEGHPKVGKQPRGRVFEHDGGQGDRISVAEDYRFSPRPFRQISLDVVQAGPGLTNQSLGGVSHG
jgi:hypothetical protein